MNSAGPTSSDPKWQHRERGDEDAYIRQKEQGQLGKLGEKLKEGVKEKVQGAGSSTQEASGGAQSSSAA
ncbi:hypothetical protein BCR35DRAFT_335952 [Leucosporidium creatinivorum]|uniref:ATPase inhibitor, mitochondrial n=1 Tax=Leucosporidium creatinivorum TaxID=106004 RepID=A0A1Y2D0A8_9BASI|nr:hypothetical protein BCR35DRAFT_335952 [Leucosporidium creatinivorum]